MIPVRFPVILGFTHPVSPLRAGLHGFWGTWLRYNSQYSDKLILMGSALLWCFATRRSTQAMAIVLVKCCNAVAEHHSNARRVGLSASMAALHLLQRTMAIRCEACLALNTDRPTEPINISLSEYQEWNNHYSGHPALHPSGQPSCSNRSRRFSPRHYALPCTPKTAHSNPSNCGF
jgi:hypothetical protein